MSTPESKIRSGRRSRSNSRVGLPVKGRYVWPVVAVSLASVLGASYVGPASGTASSLPPEVLQIVAEADGLAAEIFADGQVTPVELEGAVGAYRDCLESNGVKVVEFEFDRYGLDGDLRAVFEAGDPEQSRSAEVASHTCMAEVLSPVAAAYQYLMPEEERQKIGEIESRFVECARAHDVEAKDFADANALLSGDVRAECAGRATGWDQSDR